MKALLAIPAAIMLAGPSPVAAPSIPWNAIVIVRCGNAVGTAFHIGTGRYLTAHHVLRMGGGGCSINGTPASVSYANETIDVAELSGPVIADSFTIDCSGFQSGKHYLAVGYSGGKYRLDLPLIYSAFGRDANNGNGQFVGPDLHPGMSGGPTISEKKRAAGISTQRWPSRARALADTFLCGAEA